MSVVLINAFVSAGENLHLCIVPGKSSEPIVGEKNNGIPKLSHVRTLSSSADVQRR
jgi:hypothetical protein